MSYTNSAADIEELRERCKEVRKRLNAGDGASRYPTYATWYLLFQRCYNPDFPAYKYYGAKGVVVCDRWFNFQEFRHDVGHRPEGYTLDRIDPRKDYCPENCRWASRRTQAENKRADHELNDAAEYFLKMRRRAKISQLLESLSKEGFDEVARTFSQELDIPYVSAE